MIRQLCSLKSLILFLNLLILNILILSSCSEDDLPKYNVLGELRVIALLADLPEVNPSQTVTITPIVSDFAESTQLTYSAAVCIDPGISVGSDPTCTGSASRLVLATDQAISSPDVVSARGFTGFANTLSFTVPDASTILAQRSPVQVYNGVIYLFEYILKNSRGQSVQSFKRILVSDTSKTTKNANPILADLFMDGVAMTGLPLSTTTTASLSWTGTPNETYTRLKTTGELISEVEENVITWFISDGKMKNQRTLNNSTNEYVGPASTPSGRPAFFIVVARDGRGGEHAVIKCFGGGVCP